MAGDVETGYIDKHRHELFAKTPIEGEVVAQVALSCLRKDMGTRNALGLSGPAGSPVGFSPGYQRRQFSFVEASVPEVDDAFFDAQVLQTGEDTFNIVVNGRNFENIKSFHDAGSNVITSFFPNTRLDTTVVRDNE